MSNKDTSGSSKRQQFREKRRRAEQRTRFITLGGIILVAAAFAYFLIYPNLKPVEMVTITPIPRTQVDFNNVGDPNAPIKLAEYSDFQCPFCARFSHDTEQQLLDVYVATGKVYFTYHSVGEFIGPESVAAAQAAYCAGDQGKFWEYHDMVFANQNGENVGWFSDRRLAKFAETLGLDLNEFNSCFNNGKYADLVTKDYTDARDAGVQSTPTFILTYTANGQTVTRKLEGAQPISAFQQEIEAALAEAGK
jgi:protein-disulfide isomerase